VAVKWFPSNGSLRPEIFSPGNLLPHSLGDGLYLVGPYRDCGCEAEGYLVIEVGEGRFVGFSQRISRLEAHQKLGKEIDRVCSGKEALWEVAQEIIRTTPHLIEKERSAF
jgi:hypothetical protein